MLMLGLAARGRNVASGEFQTEKAIKTGAGRLVVVAEDASANTKKRFVDKCSYYGVSIFFYGTKEELGRAIGKEYRSGLAVLEKGLAKSVKDLLEKAGYADAKVDLPPDAGEDWEEAGRAGPFRGGRAKDTSRKNLGHRGGTGWER